MIRSKHIYEQTIEEMRVKNPEAYQEWLDKKQEAIFEGEWLEFELSNKGG